MQCEPSSHACASGNDFQAALDQLDVVGMWEWDILKDEVRADELVARLFGVDPEKVSKDVKLSAFTAGIHPDDRARVEQLIGQTAAEGGMYVAEYRVRSVDQIERWVFARGRFYLNSAGVPISGRGIVIDITQAHSEETSDPYFARADSARDGALDRLAEHCIGAHREAKQVDNKKLQDLIGAALLEVGHEIARQMLADNKNILH